MLDLNNSLKDQFKQHTVHFILHDDASYKVNSKGQFLLNFKHTHTNTLIFTTALYIQWAHISNHFITFMLSFVCLFVYIMKRPLNCSTIQKLVLRTRVTNAVVDMTCQTKKAKKSKMWLLVMVKYCDNANKLFWENFERIRRKWNEFVGDTWIRECMKFDYLNHHLFNLWGEGDCAYTQKCMF